MLLHNRDQRWHEPIEKALDELLLASPPPEDGLIVGRSLEPVCKHHPPVEVVGLGHDEATFRNEAG